MGGRDSVRRWMPSRGAELDEAAPAASLRIEGCTCTAPPRCAAPQQVLISLGISAVHLIPSPASERNQT